MFMQSFRDAAIMKEPNKDQKTLTLQMTPGLLAFSAVDC